MKNIFFVFIVFMIVYACTKTETSTPAPPVVIKLSSCDSIKQGLLKTTPDSVRLISCLSITNCDSVRLGILKPNTQDTLRLLSCIKITGCDSVRLGIFKPNTQDTLRLLTCIKIAGCDSIRLGILKPNKADTLRLLSCIKIFGCDSIRLGILKPNKSDTLRLLSCIKISGCDSVRLGLLKSAQDLLRLGCNYIEIGTQKWMDKNLDVVTYRNGDVIPQVTDASEWYSLTTGAWCYYNNDPANGAIYGKLYNWYAVNDSRGLAPKGWHIPTIGEWDILSNFLGGDAVAGGKMKSTGIIRWNSPNTDATNESGFTGFPGGYRGSGGGYGSLGNEGYWWSATMADGTTSLSRALNNHNGVLSRYWGSEVHSGFSVRCIRD